VGETAAGIAGGDFNGDGRLDLVTANRDSNDVSVLLADGAGTFAEEQRSCVVAAVPPCPQGSDPTAVVVGEMTGDTNADLAVANRLSDTVSILAGDGTGDVSLASTLTLIAGMSPSSIAIGDLNGDLEEDLVVVGEGSTRIGVFLGNGNGTFTPPLGFPPTAGTNPTAATLGLLDADSNLDLVVANYGADSVTILMGDGDGTFTGAPTVSAGSEPTDVAVGDLDGDLIADLAVTLDDDNAVTVFLGNGDGSFGAAGAMQDVHGGAGGPFAVQIVDLDGDGSQDLAVTAGPLVFVPGNGDGTFDEPEWYASETPASWSGEMGRFVAGDFDLDTRIDVAGASESEWVTVLLNQSGPEMLVFESDGETLCWPAQVGALYYDIYRGDLAGLVDGNGDGLPDGGYGSCMTSLDGDARDTFFLDADLPGAAGAGFFYLMSVVDGGGSGGAGSTSGGLPRNPAAPCP